MKLGSVGCLVRTLLMNFVDVMGLGWCRQQGGVWDNELIGGGLCDGEHINKDVWGV